MSVYGFECLCTNLNASVQGLNASVQGLVSGCRSLKPGGIECRNVVFLCNILFMFVLIFCLGDETVADVFRDFSNMGSRHPEKLKRERFSDV